MTHEKNSTQQMVSYTYHNNPIRFSLNGNVMVNATQMAKKFPQHKRPVFWLKLQSTDEFISALSRVRNLTLADLVTVRNGGNMQGTWMHEDVALEFARWLSPEFAIWCNDRIKEILLAKEGKGNIFNKTKHYVNIQVNEPAPANNENTKYRRKRVETYLPADDVLKLQIASHNLGYNSTYQLLQHLIQTFLKNPNYNPHKEIEYLKDSVATWERMYKDRCEFVDYIASLLKDVIDVGKEERALRKKAEKQLKQFMLTLA